MKLNQLPYSKSIERVNFKTFIPTHAHTREEMSQTGRAEAVPASLPQTNYG